MERPIVSVYLNHKLVFDLLAMLDNGISTVTTVSQSTSVTNNSNENISANFGINNVLASLVKIGVSAQKADGVQSQKNQTLSEDKIQTPASLFFQLKNLLTHNGFVTAHDSPELKSGDFVEINVSLKKSPALASLEGLHGIIDLMHSVTEAKQPAKNKNSAEHKPFLDVKKEISVFIERLNSGKTTDLIHQSNNPDKSIVVSLEKEFLNDSEMSDLIDGQFVVFGKVINLVDKDNSINLLRKSHFGSLPASTIEIIFGKLTDMASMHGFPLPTPTANISGPAIQIIPIAIYA